MEKTATAKNKKPEGVRVSVQIEIVILPDEVADFVASVSELGTANSAKAADAIKSQHGTFTIAFFRDGVPVGRIEQGLPVPV